MTDDTAQVAISQFPRDPLGIEDVLKLIRGADSMVGEVVVEPYDGSAW